MFVQHKTKTRTKKQKGLVAQTEEEEFRYMAHRESEGQSVPPVMKRHQKVGQEELNEHWVDLLVGGV